MATYEESGVNISLGDKCSRIAYEASKATFQGRKNMIGEPVIDEGGFSGILNMGDFYLVQNDDGIGTKIIIGEKINQLETMGYDLLAMVADDAICIGAETISVTNTIDVPKVDEEKISVLMSGLKKAALEQKIVIPGGEIAELGEMVNGYVWNATAVGVIKKDKLITGKNIKVGDKIIGLASKGFRSNGFSLIRHILKENFGENWYEEKYDESQTWGSAVLTPSKIYSSAILELHGRFVEKPKVEIKGIAHITGGGLYENTARVLKKTNLKANFTNLLPPHEIMLRLIKMGDVSEKEAYRTWNMGIGMVLICNEFDKVSEVCSKYDIKTQIIGEIVN